MSELDRSVVINEVGLRDGLQNQPVEVRTDDKIDLAELLIAAGVRHFEAGSFVSPKAVPRMADAREVFGRLGDREDVELSALIPNDKGYERAREAGVRAVAVVLSATETMNRENIRMNLDETRRVCTGIIARARADGVNANGYVAVAFECPYEGPVAPDVVTELTGDLFDAGADRVIIADTIGAANPEQVYRLFANLGREFGAKRLAAHLHDTRALGAANAWAALHAGIRRFDSSIGGLGGCPFAPGAAGNVATEDLVLMFEQCGWATGIDVDRLLPAVEKAGSMTGQQLGGRALTWYRNKKKRQQAPQRDERGQCGVMPN